MEQVLQARSSLWESSEPMICDSIGRCFADSPHFPPGGTVCPHSPLPTVAEGAMHLLTYVPGGSRLHCIMLFDRDPSFCFQSSFVRKLSNYENRRIRIFSKHFPVWVLFLQQQKEIIFMKRRLVAISHSFVFSDCFPWKGNSFLRHGEGEYLSQSYEVSFKG